MADKPATKKPARKPAPKYATVDQLNDITEAIKGLTGFVKDLAESTKTTAAEVAAKIPETPLEKEVKKAGPNYVVDVNPEWKAKAEEIVGDALDHVEVQHLRSGGIVFTIVIKNEYSNATDSYLAEHKTDRRSKEVGAEGIGGVEQWCKLVKQNLARPKPQNSNVN